jgi:hypothetical protein
MSIDPQLMDELDCDDADTDDGAVVLLKEEVILVEVYPRFSALW